MNDKTTVEFVFRRIGKTADSEGVIGLSFLLRKNPQSISHNIDLAKPKS